jgi:hypothetical protein
MQSYYFDYLFNFATIWFEVMLSAVSTDLGLLEIVDFSAFIFFLIWFLSLLGQNIKFVSTH